MKPVVLGFLLLVSLAHANPAFDRWADSVAASWVRLSPQFATRVQYFSGAEQDALDRQLSLHGTWGESWGTAAAEERAALARRGLAELKAFPRASLTGNQVTSAALIQWALTQAVTGATFARETSLFNQMSGMQLSLVNFLTQTHPIRNRRDVENYLARLALVGPRLDEALREADAAGRAGLVAPRFILERTIEQIDGFLGLPPRENVFVLTLDTRIRALGTAVSDADRASLVAEAEKVVAGGVIPAYGRVRALLASQLPASTADAGVWRFPRGQDFYASSLALYTTTSLSPDEVHAIGLREVARIEAEMDQILRTLGSTSGTVKERYDALDRSLQPPASPDPRPALVATALRHVRDAERRAAGLFDRLPRAPVDVRREPAFSERTAPAHYSSPAPDGSGPGIFWMPLPGPTYRLLDLRSLCYHEAVPGHHFQIALQQEMKDLPRWRSLGVFGFISAYGEGWALYAERLADENGWYEGDPQGRLGYLNSALFRARRLVVDTGLHTKKWTRQQAIDYGIPAHEVERYVAWPGQACSYMIGQLRIVELREQARAALGSRFSIKEFHNTVLGTGNVPLDVLADEVKAWVASK